jgi:hypothetical protein
MKLVPTIALVAMLAGCAAAAPGWDTKHTVTGVLTVRGSTLGGGCIPEYEFIREGARVRLSYPDDDSTIGESSLGPITPLLLETTPDARSWTRSMKCTSTFTVTGVPEVPWYYVEMGGSGLCTWGNVSTTYTD